jgi:hypothetical protein
LSPGVGARFRLLARRRGCARYWRWVTAAVLGVDVAAVDALAGEPVPTTPAEAAAVARRHGVDARLLRRVLDLVGRRSPPGR